MKLNYENPSSQQEEISFSENELESITRLKDNLIDTLEQYKALLDVQLLLKK